MFPADYFTVIVIFAFFFPAVAVITVFPFFFAFTRPFWLTVAILVLLLFHFTLSVLLDGVTFAFKVTFLPFLRVSFDLDLPFTVTLTFVAGEVTVTLTIFVRPLELLTVTCVFPGFLAVIFPVLSTEIMLAFPGV